MMFTSGGGSVVERKVRIPLPGWNLEQRQGLDFLMEDARIAGTWVSDAAVVVFVGDELQVRKLVELLNIQPVPLALAPKEAPGVTLHVSSPPSELTEEPFPPWVAQPGLRIA